MALGVLFLTVKHYQSDSSSDVSLHLDLMFVGLHSDFSLQFDSKVDKSLLSFLVFDQNNLPNFMSNLEAMLADSSRIHC